MSTATQWLIIALIVLGVDTIGKPFEALLFCGSVVVALVIIIFGDALLARD